MSLAFFNISGSESEKESALETFHQTFPDERKELKLAIKTLAYILKRALTFIMKPEALTRDLGAVAAMASEKAEIVTKFWMNKTKGVLAESGISSGRELVNIDTKLDIELSSSAEQKSRLPVAGLRLATADGERIGLELNHQELFEVYTCLESIQDELDFLKEN